MLARRRLAVIHGKQSRPLYRGMKRLRHCLPRSSQHEHPFRVAGPYFAALRYLRLKRSTRPPESTSFCFPV